MLQTEARAKPRQRPSTTHADKIFGKYRREDHRVVRPADVSLDLPRDLRQRREMLRRMTPEQALAVIEFYGDLDFFQALELARREGKLIVPHDVHDRILTETSSDRYLIRVYPVRAGTVVIYEAPDKPFGMFVEFEGILFDVPEQFRGKTNCALVVDHPDFDLIEHELVVPDPSQIHLIEEFPEKDGWYMLHAKTAIPQGNEVSESDDARYIWRNIDGLYVGSVARSCGGFDGRRRGVDLGDGPSDGYGVALF